MFLETCICPKVGSVYVNRGVPCEVIDQYDFLV